MRTSKVLCSVLLIVCLVFAAAACTPTGGPKVSDDPTTPNGNDNGEGDSFIYEEKTLEVPSLMEVFKDDFLMGVGLEPAELLSYGDLIGYHFNSITPGNSMKPDATQPQEGNFQFNRGDMIVDYAMEHDMEVHGHTLIWHSQTPPWFFQENGDQVSRETAIERMREHIFTVVEKYKGTIVEWDVVNEPINDNGDGLRDSPWLRAIGDDYIKLAYQFAHEADPDAKLVLNDFNIEVAGKRDAFIDLVEDMQADGVPLHAVGIQGHWQLGWPSYDTIRRTLELFTEFGLEIQITEIDVSMYDWSDRGSMLAPTADLLKSQADRYQALFSIFKEFDSIKKVTTWGFADDDTWLDNHPVKGRKDWPMMFDLEQKPKESFWRVVEEPVLSNIEAEEGVWLKPFECGTLTHLLRVNEGVDQVRFKPTTNDRRVEFTVEGAEKDGDEYIIDIGKQAPQATITVSGYDKENTYEIYVREDKKEAIAKWEFNEGEGDTSKDDAGYTDDAYVGDTSWVEGIDGSAIEFTGQGEIVKLGLGRGNMFGSNNFSVSYWIKPQETVKSSRILWYGEPVSTSATLWRTSILTGGGLQFHVQMPLDEDYKGSQFLSTDSGVIQEGEWSHVLCVRENNSLTIYVNGEEKAKETFDYIVDLTGFTQPLIAGADKDQTGDRYKGALDSIRIYNYALSLDDAKGIFEGKGK
ncbi:MAG TPA: endo-1,4-beta-xylanase [Bacillota bacterium]|nr:endo-1,4-beta-xylanase [Bacillota bacterium]